MIRSIGRTELRVVLALLLVGLLPLLSATWLANKVVNNVTSTAFQPEFGERLERSLGLYAELVKTMKRRMRTEGALMAADDELRRASAAADEAGVRRALVRLMASRPDVLEASVLDVEDDVVATLRRATVLDERRERPFTVMHSLSDGDASPVLSVIFAADRTRVDEMGAAQDFVKMWKTTADEFDEWSLDAFAVLLVTTVILAVFTGLRVVRPAIRRINELAAATGPVAQGDLDVRVPAEGEDEIAELARAFNSMLEQLGQSRARIEFLKRVGEWQNMARRLAHEIKNPLTPIQLAVEECAGRYGGEDPKYKKLLDTTLDIVREEVQSLRRLVTEFANFARLPRAELRREDLGDFLRDQLPRLQKEALSEDEVSLVVDDGVMPVALDRTMFYRVLSNLVTNGLQAAREAGEGARVRVEARAQGGGWVVEVEDNGPGIDDALLPNIFDPYVTTKEDGTGLGLTIVKKIVIDHGGQIDARLGEGGGAIFRMRLPLLGSIASEVAVAQSEPASVGG
ncbi:MAG: ATP-binding protein [Polyangiaceae bacterium]